MKQLGFNIIMQLMYAGFMISFVQTFAKQILQCVGALHAVKLTHTDLKPENILLINSHYDEVKITKKERENYHCLNRVTDSHTTVSRNRSYSRSRSQHKRLYSHKTRDKSIQEKMLIPRHDKIKLIDFGGATFDNEHHSTVINTRQYRAPEVILECCRWDQISDVWSIACIILELYSGTLYFDTHNNYEHLALIQKQYGSFPAWMVNKAPRNVQEHFLMDKKLKESKGIYLNWPKQSTTHESLKQVIQMKTYKQIISSEHSELIDLMDKMFEVDPHQRISCWEALQHDFFKVKYEDKYKKQN